LAAADCLARKHFELEIEHLLPQLLRQPQGDLALICCRFGMDISNLSLDLEKALRTLRTGKSGYPTLGPVLAKVLARAAGIASADFSSASIRPAFVIMALIAGTEFAGVLRLSDEWKKIQPDVLQSGISTPFCGWSRSPGFKRNIPPPRRPGFSTAAST
jgi:type VI secretion system protein VasG